MSEPRVRISKPRLAWLQEESARWRDAGIVDAGRREILLAGYEAEPSGNRGMIALVIVAVLIGGVGILLLIGYNWARIPPAVKVTMLVGAVALAFAGAAAAYARRRLTIGETLAFAGTVLLANAIWLVAQVLHIQGHFPDAFLWIAVGCLATAWLVRSRWIGLEAAILMIAWLVAESTFFPQPLYGFLVLGTAGIWLAYNLRSGPMLRVLAFGMALWVFFATIGNNASRLAPAAVALAGCALYAAGRWHNGDGHMRRAWQDSGIAVILIALIPLMIRDAHHVIHSDSATTRSIVIAFTMAACAFSAAARPLRAATDRSVLAAAALVVMWAALLWSGPATGSDAFRFYAVIAFSVMTIVMAATLIRTAFLSNRRSDLYLGVLFALAFIVVRWTSLIENMMWSGLLLLLTAGGLLAIAWFWRHRDRGLIKAERS